jgi:HPt (histidine-containing phosphotransfer) domain-containing protein
MKLTFRFLVLIIALLAAVGASAVAGSRAVSSLGTALDGVVNRDMRRLLAITHARRAFRSMTLLERDHILATTAQERETLTKKIESLAKELETHLRNYERAMPPEDRPAIQGIVACRTRWLELDARVLRAAQDNRQLALELSKEHQTDPVSWEAEIGKLVKLSEQRLERRVQETNQIASLARSTLLIVSAIAAALAAALGSMIFLAIRRNMAELVMLNGDLERMVQERTRELAAREASLRAVLDSTDDGLITVEPRGDVGGECSAAAVAWFGPPRAGQPFWEYLLPNERVQHQRFQLSFEQLRDEMMPWEASVGQMPARLERDGRIVELHYMAIRSQEVLQRILIAARDVTLRVRSEDAEQASREEHALFASIVRDRAGFAAFVQECEELFQRLQESRDQTTQARDLHTLKGNAGLFGLHSLARACHLLEDRLDEAGRGPTAEEIGQLLDIWRGKLRSVEDLLRKDAPGALEIEAAEYSRLIRSLTENGHCAEILRVVERWTWTPTAVRLRRLASLSEYLAARLGKEVEVQVVHHDVRLPDDYLAGFWPTLTHVIRNAVDHGLETSDERTASGKSGPGRIWLETLVSDAAFTLTIRDDGRGVDREALLKRAEELGMDVSERSTLDELLFRDGLSSRSEATELSGRGVGLAATKQACEAAGGRLVVTSERGRGTSFSFHFRPPEVEPDVERQPSADPIRLTAMSAMA